MEPEFLGPNGFLKDSLYRDAQQSRHYGHGKVVTPLDQRNVEQSVVTTYSELYAHLARQSGYPKLYRLGWELLIQLALARDWLTLAIIDQIFDVALPNTAKSDINAVMRDHAHEFSPWHLKAMLYVWSRPPKHGGIVPDNRENLLSLIEISSAFINMTPQEATLRLAQAHLNNMNALPYLFRLSTTEPGAIALSFLTPVSNQVLHKRFTHIDALAPFLSGENNSVVDIYHLMVQGFVAYLLAGRLHEATLSMDELVLVMRQLDPKLTESTVRNKLRRVPVPLTDSSAYETLRSHFFPSLSQRLLTPQSTEERVGVTKSYTGSYVSISSAVGLGYQQQLPYLMKTATMQGEIPELPCFTCRVREATRKETDNNRLYCSDVCYDDDSVLCY